MRLGSATRAGARPRGVRHVVAVASGKGGVGKSTVSANLAIAMLHEGGGRIGILDADIYGPSMHRMMNLKGRPQVTADKLLVPMENYGVKTLSMGNLVAEDSPTIWRGPMAMTAIDQLLHQTLWDPLDVLVVDLPPGTSDIHLSLSQRCALSGAVIVSTPQDIALIDARRAANMFRQVNVPLLGVVENMSYYICPKCNHREEPFGHAGARHSATEMGVDFLGEIPLHAAIRLLSDEGRPATVASPDSAYVRPYFDIAKRLLAKLHAMPEHDSGPKISVE